MNVGGHVALSPDVAADTALSAMSVGGQVPLFPDVAADTAFRSLYLFTLYGEGISNDSDRGAIWSKVVDAYNKIWPAGDVIDYGAVAIESCPATGRWHAHVSVSCSRRHRWRQVKNEIRSGGMSCHVSEHKYYRTMVHYLTVATATKPRESLDGNIFLSQSHPPIRRALVRTKEEEGDPAVAEPPAKKPRRSVVLSVYNYVTMKNIKCCEELRYHADVATEADDPTLLEFCHKHGDALQAKIDDLWRTKNARAAFDRKKKSRWQLVQDATSSDCVCDGTSVTGLRHILSSNSIDEKGFLDALRDPLKDGRLKGNTVMLVGPANCGKSSLLKGLGSIFKVFRKPESSSNAPLAQLGDFEVVVWDDLRYNPGRTGNSQGIKIDQGTMHLWLEGSDFVVHQHGNLGSDFVYSKDAPVYFTGPSRLSVIYTNGIVDAHETAQLDARIRYIMLNSPLARPDAKFRTCGRCYARWLADMSI
jgi:hypothetical protein